MVVLDEIADFERQVVGHGRRDSGLAIVTVILRVIEVVQIFDGLGEFILFGEGIDILAEHAPSIKPREAEFS